MISVYLFPYLFILIILSFFDIFNKNRLPIQLIYAEFLLAIFVNPFLTPVLALICYIIHTKLEDDSNWFLKKGDIYILLVSLVFINYKILFVLLLLAIGLAYITKLITKEEVFGFIPYYTLTVFLYLFYAVELLNFS